MSPETFRRRARDRFIISVIIWVSGLILKYTLWNLLNNAFFMAFAMLLLSPLYLCLLLWCLNLLYQPFKAIYRWIRGVDGMKAFVWTLLPWLVLGVVATTDALCYEGYLAWRRPAVLRQVQAGVLKPEYEGSSVLQTRLIDHWTSCDGTIMVFQNTPDKLIVGFWLSRGIICTPSTYIIYTSGEAPPTAEELNETPENILQVEEQSPHWYIMTIDY